MKFNNIKDKEIFIVKYNSVLKFLLLFIPYFGFIIITLIFGFYFTDKSVFWSFLFFIASALSLYLLIKKYKIVGFYFYEDKIVQISTLEDPIEIYFKFADIKIIYGKYKMFSFSQFNSELNKFNNIAIDRNLLSKSSEQDIFKFLSEVLKKDINENN
jgi:hypothetical protein